jgi:hypothetical protein
VGDGVGLTGAYTHHPLERIRLQFLPNWRRIRTPDVLLSLLSYSSQNILGWWWVLVVGGDGGWRQHSPRNKIRHHRPPSCRHSPPPTTSSRSPSHPEPPADRLKGRGLVDGMVTRAVINRNWHAGRRLVRGSRFPTRQRPRLGHSRRFVYPYPGAWPCSLRHTTCMNPRRLHLGRTAAA